MKKLLISLLLLFTCYSLIGQERYLLQMNAELLAVSFDVMMNQVGTKEVGNNSGKKVREYLKSVGLSAGQPYCMAGQYYCYDVAAKKLNIRNPLLKTGSTYSQWYYLKSKSTRTSYSPQIHDLIFWKRSGRLGHVERIIEVGKYGIVKTVGFNTGSNVRDGDGVYIKKRSILHPIGRLQVRGLIGFKSS